MNKPKFIVDEEAKWRLANPSKGINLSVFRDAIIEKFSPVVEDIDYIEIKDEPKQLLK
jgi:hypothetical protein